MYLVGYRIGFVEHFFEVIFTEQDHRSSVTLRIRIPVFNDAVDNHLRPEGGIRQSAGNQSKTAPRVHRSTIQAEFRTQDEIDNISDTRSPPRGIAL